MRYHRLSRSLAVATAAALAVLLAACGSTAPETDSSEPQTRTIIDLAGNEVEIPTGEVKVAASYPAVDQIFVLLGAEDHAAALNGNNTTNTWLLKIAPEMADLPVVFDPSGEFDPEALLAADPDVVIVTSQEIADAVEAVGVPAVVAMGTSVETLEQTIELVGDIVGAEDRADELVAYYEDNMSQATERTASLSDDERTRVYYATGTGVLNTEAGGSIVTDWIEMAGGRNVATDAGIEGMFIDVTAEQVLSWDPEVVMCTSVEVCDQFAADPVFKDTPAVRNGAVYPSPEGVFTWSVRSADEATMTLWAATKIQPDLFSDVDYVQITQDFYKQFYGYDLSEAEANGILEP